MTRIFISDSLRSDQVELRLDKEQQIYLKSVLRMNHGDIIIVCDKSMTDYTCAIDNFDSEGVNLRIIGFKKNDSEPNYRVMLFQSVSKGERMDYTIQKSVELGVDTIIPVDSARTIVKVKDKDGSGKLDRWSKIALEASRQSGRGKVVEVTSVVRFQKALEMAKSISDIVIIPWENETDKSFGQVLESFFSHKRELLDFPNPALAENSSEEGIYRPSISVFIGPEGGFEKEEVEAAIQSGAIPVTLGKRILRTETAGPSVLAMLLYRFELN